MGGDWWLPWIRHRLRSAVDGNDGWRPARIPVGGNCDWRTGRPDVWVSFKEEHAARLEKAHLLDSSSRCAGSSEARLVTFEAERLISHPRGRAKRSGAGSRTGNVRLLTAAAKTANEVTPFFFLTLFSQPSCFLRPLLVIIESNTPQ